MTLSCVLYALSDPLRLSIVLSLANKGAQPCCALSLPVAKSTASHHFRVLREAGIIRMEQDGTQLINSLRQADLDSRFPGLLDVVLNVSETDMNS